MKNELKQMCGLKSAKRQTGEISLSVQAIFLSAWLVGYLIAMLA